MSDYRLFVEIRVFEQLRVLRPAERSRLLASLEEIRQRPAVYADFSERDAEGRLVQIHIVGKFAVKYWEDFADRHLKVLDITNADSSSR
jgi:hypothetical protein